ncbi:MAG: hypothetical protein JWN84_863 [Nocardioides sp.]|jgi:hypothetical protein|nr:hypothetical protein [Nocardioides sp.]
MEQQGAGDDVGARFEDVVQEAVDATSTAYTNDAGIDVEDFLRGQLSSRGVADLAEPRVGGLVAAIRSGHGVELGEHDGSVQP